MVFSSRLLQKINIMKQISLLGLLPFSLLPQSVSGQTAKTSPVSPQQKPNIVFILADDMGYGDVSALNEKSHIQTPNLDRMAANGVAFTDAHSSSSVSTPTRYGILTGRYNWRSQLKNGVLYGYSRSIIPTTRSTMASMLKSNGYATACIGKWHLGWSWGTKTGHEKTDAKALEEKDVDYTLPISNGPADLGFDYFYGFCGSLDMPPYVYVENRHATTTHIDTVSAGKKLAFWRKGAIGNDFTHQECLPNLTKRAVRYIDQQAKNERPFFLYLPLPAPHTPILPDKRFKGKTGLGDYGDFVLMVDDVVGQIREALQRNGIADNTLLVFTADNGCSPAADIPHMEARGHHPNYIWRGTKADLFDGGHRVPTIVEWGNKAGKGQCTQTICLNDFYATFAALNNYKIKDNEAEDSYNILPLIQTPNHPATIREATVHHSIRGEFAIRKGDWKLLCSPSSGGWSFPRPGTDKEVIATLPPIQLYNMKTDPTESKNVYSDHPEIVKELKELLQKYIREGRSTPGSMQANDATSQWTQIESIMQND